jgi:hypothetical protein
MFLCTFFTFSHTPYFIYLGFGMLFSPHVCATEKESVDGCGDLDGKVKESETKGSEPQRDNALPWSMVPPNRLPGGLPDADADVAPTSPISIATLIGVSSRPREFPPDAWQGWCTLDEETGMVTSFMPTGRMSSDWKPEDRHRFEAMAQNILDEYHSRCCYTFDTEAKARTLSRLWERGRASDDLGAGELFEGDKWSDETWASLWYKTRKDCRGCLGTRRRSPLLDRVLHKQGIRAPDLEWFCRCHILPNGFRWVHPERLDAFRELMKHAGVEDNVYAHWKIPMDENTQLHLLYAMCLPAVKTLPWHCNIPSCCVCGRQCLLSAKQCPACPNDYGMKYCGSHCANVHYPDHMQQHHYAFLHCTPAEYDERFDEPIPCEACHADLRLKPTDPVLKTLCTDPIAPCRYQFGWHECKPMRPSLRRLVNRKWTQPTCTPLANLGKRMRRWSWRDWLSFLVFFVLPALVFAVAMAYCYTFGQRHVRTQP